LIVAKDFTQNPLPRGVGEKCPFSGSKVPFTSVKNVIRIAFFAQRHLIYDWICFCILVCPENFRVKLCYIQKLFWYVQKMFFILGKKCDISGKNVGMSGNFFEINSPPVAHISWKKF
jgi:hypothetical protein